MLELTLLHRLGKLAVEQVADREGGRHQDGDKSGAETQ
jgi:hypothetical protein